MKEERPSARILPDDASRYAEEIDEILTRHLSWIQGYVHHKLGDFRRSKADTGDIVQEATIQFLQYGPKIKLMDEGQFRALLGRIIENVIRDKYDWFTACRRNISNERPLPPDTILNLDPPKGRQETPSQIVQKQDEEAWLRLGLELLEPKEREVIVLHHWEHLSFIKIGKMLGVSKVAARKRYMRALNLLIDVVESLKSGKLDTLLGPDPLKEMEA